MTSDVDELTGVAGNLSGVSTLGLKNIYSEYEDIFQVRSKGIISMPMQIRSKSFLHRLWNVASALHNPKASPYIGFFQISLSMMNESCFTKSCCHAYLAFRPQRRSSLEYTIPGLHTVDLSATYMEVGIGNELTLNKRL